MSFFKRNKTLAPSSLSIALTQAGSALKDFAIARQDMSRRMAFSETLSACFERASWQSVGSEAVLHLIEQSAKIDGGYALLQLDQFAHKVQNTDTQYKIAALLLKLATPQNIDALLQQPFKAFIFQQVQPSVVEKALLKVHMRFEADNLSPDNADLFIGVAARILSTNAPDKHPNLAHPFARTALEVNMRALTDTRLSEENRRRAFNMLSDSTFEPLMQDIEPGFVDGAYAQAMRAYLVDSQLSAADMRKDYIAYPHKVEDGSAMGKHYQALFGDILDKISLLQSPPRADNNPVMDFVADIATSRTINIRTLKDLALKRYCKANEGKDIFLPPIRTTYYCKAIHALNALEHGSSSAVRFKNASTKIMQCVEDAHINLLPSHANEVTSLILRAAAHSPYATDEMLPCVVAVLEKHVEAEHKAKGTDFADILSKPKSHYFLSAPELNVWPVRERVALSLIDKYVSNEATRLIKSGAYLNVMNEGERTAYTGPLHSPL